MTTESVRTRDVQVDALQAIALDNIVKGYIIDRGVEVLRQHGFGDVLVEAVGRCQAHINDPKPVRHSE